MKAERVDQVSSLKYPDTIISEQDNLRIEITIEQSRQALANSSLQDQISA